jgi:ribosomal-protein-alanine N-acetyltransferase
MTPPTIDLTGIRLRGLRPEDAVAWHAYLSDPLVIEFTSYPVMSLAAVQAMIQRCREGYASGDSCTWAVATEADDELIGTCGFNALSRSQGWAELSYVLARPYWEARLHHASRKGLPWLGIRTTRVQPGPCLRHGRQRAV